MFDSHTNVCTPICWLIICQYVYTNMLTKYADNCASMCLRRPVYCGSASTLWWCQAVIKYVNTSRGPSAFGRSTKLNDKAIIWSKLRLGVDTHQMDTMIGERLQIKPHLLSHTSVTQSQLLQRAFYARPIRWRIADIANAMLATVTIVTIVTVMLMEFFFW